ncbi:hypothetical protein N783_03315 [Pontibacillus marinus BH030004 = DSM 16465]|uniref:Uncharacterized protein n=1 Tax=Pontibacillus marinus BH030004 = DSM 16465 TaxID=1385511 RepID=A0A0A5G9V4_9BACI|nr:hypothetical protein N783_03315 [Pontibacillus marinus BH030004 = DSM 16465]
MLKKDLMYKEKAKKFLEQYDKVYQYVVNVP